MPYAALPTLRTPRLTLRPLRRTDADAITAGVGNFDVSKWLSVVPYPFVRDDALGFIDRLQSRDDRVWGICNARGLVGVAAIEGELGYWLARPAWGRGYGFEAAHAVVAHWFDDPARGSIETGYFDITF